LATTGAGQHWLDANSAFGKQQGGGTARVVLAEDGVAPQQGVAGILGERIGPARREACPAGRMGDGLGGHVGVADQTAEQVAFAVDAQWCVACRVDQGIGGQVIVVGIVGWWLAGVGLAAGSATVQGRRPA
jgi:hypothetical protein